MADKVLLIADGHHRYETALNYRKEQEARGPVPDSAALRFKTAAFINITDPGLVILPTHRLLYDLGAIDWDAALRKIRDWFAVAEVATTAAPAELAAKAAEPWPVFALHAGKGRTWLLSLRDPKAVERFVPDRSPDYRELAVVVLHTLLIDKVFGVPADQVEDHVAYERKPEAALAAVDAGRCQVALLLNATRAEQVSRVAGHGERMPQKSTDFYPKLVSGLVFFDVATGQRV
jgi:uncharacterized protein (DUF1015 family)